jgi:tRNA (guanine-N7-)-methyltransferase
MLIERHIRSFVRREGRMTDRQKTAFNHAAEKYVLSPHETFLPKEIFGKEAPVVLEIGFGMGQALFELAEANPDKHYVGIEVHRPGVGALLASIEEEGLENIRVYSEDATLILKQCILPHSISEVLIYFPDPWPKKRHNKRRLIQVEFIRQLLTVLKPEGILHCATDWEDYAHHMMEVLSSIKELTNTAGEGKFIERSEAYARRPETKFERRGQRLGHQIYDLVFSVNSPVEGKVNV